VISNRFYLMELTSKLPQRDFFAIHFSLGGVTVLAWVYVNLMARDMSAPQYLDVAVLQIQHWNSEYFGMMFLMWAVMMVGMMLPSVSPMVLIYAAVARKSENEGMPITSTTAFVIGYLIMWVAFSFFVTIAQWQLDKAALLSPMMVANSPIFGAILLVAAGVYQWLPAKDACLKQCRSPMHFISSHWRPGALGALRMGIEHGTFCIGCCWVLMLLLFVGGVMNVVWIAAITIFVLLEKMLPLGDKGGRMMGFLMIAASVIFALAGIS